jgi:hypothetical protein
MDGNTVIDLDLNSILIRCSSFDVRMETYLRPDLIQKTIYKDRSGYRTFLRLSV